jgi:putative addiction module component (TIGR02574 family)
MIPTSVPSPAGSSELSKGEQIEYLQALWDQIAQPPDEVPIRESHVQLAEQRLQQYRDDPSSARPAFKALDRLRKKRGE